MSVGGNGIARHERACCPLRLKAGLYFEKETDFTQFLIPVWDFLELVDPKDGIEIPARPRMVGISFEEALHAIDKVRVECGHWVIVRTQTEIVGPMEPEAAANEPAVRDEGKAGPGIEFPDDAVAASGEDAKTPEQRREAFEMLSRCHQDAFHQYRLALGELGSEGEDSPSMPTVYDHIKTTGCEIKEFKTWCAYVRKAKSALGITDMRYSNKPKAASRSIVNKDGVLTQT